MTNQDQRFQHRWELRRTETDLDSSSDDDHSRPNNSASDETKHMKQNLVTTQNHDEINTKKTTHQKEKLPSFNEPNKKLDQPAMKQEKKAKTKRKTSSNYEAARDDLRGHMESLVEEIITARKSLLSWLDTQLKSPSKDNNNVDNFSSNPSGTRKVQRKNTVRTKTPRKNPSSNKRNRATKVNQEDPENEKVEAPSKETKNVAVDEKLIKGKKSRVSVNKKQKKVVEVEEGDQHSNTTVAAATVDNCLNSSSKVLPQKQGDNNERAPLLEDGNDKDGGNQQKKPDQRAQQNKDGNFAKKGMMSPTMGNENGFGFGMVPQSGGIRSMPNISNQYGLQYLSHENRMARMYGEHPHPVPVPGFGNHGFVGCYSGFNQHMKFNTQQGGVMGLQCPDIRRGAFNQGNMTRQ